MVESERVMRILRGQEADGIPFTVYDTKVEMCTAERILRSKGMCLVHRMTSYDVNYERTEVSQVIRQTPEGIQRQIFYKTPSGDLSETFVETESSCWHKEYLFKSPEDYPALLALAKDIRLRENYRRAQRQKAVLGPDFVVRDQVPLEPLQELINNSMGATAFCMEWIDHREDILELYDALTVRNEEAYRLVADGPLDFANYGGNVAVSLIGPQTFREYYVPNYNKCAEILHEKGKLVGVHFDGDNRLILQDIAQTALDYVEAYDVGMNVPLDEAQKVVPEKILWLNWPSSWYCTAPEKIEKKTEELLERATDLSRIIVGVTEDVPEQTKYANFEAIQRGVRTVSARFFNRKKMM